MKNYNFRFRDLYVIFAFLLRPVIHFYPDSELD